MADEYVRLTAPADEESLDDLSIAEYRIQSIEKQVYSNKVKLVEQEQRFFAVFNNLYKAFISGRPNDRWPAVRALINLLIPGRFTLFLAIGLAIGMAGLVLIQQNNEIAASHSFYSQKQAYLQSINNRRNTLVVTNEYIYKLKEDDKSESNFSGSDKKPFYGRKIRSVALEQLIDITAHPLSMPIQAKPVPLMDLSSRWLCNNFSALCEQDKGDQADESQVANKTKLDTLDISHALLQDISWPESQARVNIDARSTNFSDANLEGVDFTGANLTTANLSGAFMSRAILVSADLSGANMPKSDLVAANLLKAVLKGANLKQANLKGANLSESNLWRVNLSRSNMSRANLLGANLSAANLSGADLSSANLLLVDFMAANLMGVNFDGANLEGANMEGAELKLSSITCEQLLTTRNWQKAKTSLDCSADD